MLYVIHGIDKPNSGPKRLELYPAHNAYLDSAEKFGVRLFMSGPLVGDDNSTSIGSLIIVEADSLATAEAYHQADPFYAAQIWESSRVMAFNKKRG